MCLEFLADQVGKYQRLHPTTERCVRLDVARILVDMNLHKPLLQEIRITGDTKRVVKISYPWLPALCARCGSWGHLSNECTNSKSKTLSIRASASTASPKSHPPATGVSDFHATTVDTSEAGACLHQGSSSSAVSDEIQENTQVLLDNSAKAAVNTCLVETTDRVTTTTENQSDTDRIQELMEDLQDHIPAVTDSQVTGQSDKEEGEWSPARKTVNIPLAGKDTSTVMTSKSSFLALQMDTEAEDDEDLEVSESTDNSEVELPNSSPAKKKTATKKKGKAIKTTKRYERGETSKRTTKASSRKR